MELVALMPHCLLVLMVLPVAGYLPVGTELGLRPPHQVLAGPVAAQLRRRRLPAGH